MRIINRQNDLNFYEYKTTPKQKLAFEVHLVDHCNLNCAYCDHFAPFAKPNYYDVHQYEKDLKRLRDLFDDDIVEIKLQGGEPLLHPSLISIFQITRKYYPYLGNVKIVTNGLLLDKQTQFFWDAMDKYRIGLFVSEYQNTGVDYQYYIDKAMDLGLNAGSFGTREVMRKDYLDLTGRQNQRQSFLTCFLANNCILLRNGYLYSCPTAGTIQFLAKYFNLNITEDMCNPIDIHTNTREEIVEKLAQDFPLCKFCSKTLYETEWKKSQHSLTEYIE